MRPLKRQSRFSPNIEGYAGMRKQELIFALLQAQIEKNG
jgi:hypothetical protein